MSVKIKKNFCIFMSVVLLLCAAPFGGIAQLDSLAMKASAIDDKLAATGSCGGDTYWTFDSETGELIINGTGNTTHYSAIEYGIIDNFDISPFKNCLSIKNIIIDEGITGIGGQIFEGCEKVESVSFPNSLKTINSHAFDGCTGLTDVTIPENVISVVGTAFANCSGLKRVFFNAIDCNDPALGGANKIFENCTSLETVIFGNKVTSIPPYAFYGCTGLKDVLIGDSITNIEYDAFAGCTSLTDIYIPEAVTSIGASAFASCSKLTNVVSYGEVDFHKYTFAGTRASIILMNNAPQTKRLAQEYGVNCIEANYDEAQRILSFNGTTTVYGGADYDYIAKVVYEHPETEYLYFNKLVFDDIKADEILILDDEINVDYSSKKLALTDVYINLAVVIDGHERNISFEKMIELLENGEYDAFKIKINSEEEGTEQTIFQKIEAFFSQISTSLIKAVSKAINFFVKIFKRK